MAVLFVQSQQSNTATAAANIAVTLPRTPIAGNLLVAYFASSSVNVTATITGWTALTNSGTGTNARSNRMFYKIAGTSESATVTTVSASSIASLVVLEYSGIDPLNPLLIENAVNTSTTASTTYTTPSVVPATGLGALVIAGVMQRQNANVAFTAQTLGGSTTGVTVRSNPNATMKQSASVFDLFVTSTTGTYTGTATQATSLVGGGAIAIFRAATTPGKILAYDTWTGTNGAAWPSQWSQTASGTDGTATIQSNAGRLSTSTASYAFGGQKLTAVSATNQRLIIDFTLQGDSSEQYNYIGIRSAGSFASYYPTRDFYVKIYVDGTGIEYGTHLDNEYGLGSTTLTGLTASGTYHLDLAVTGLTLTGYIWQGTTKPSSPTFTASGTDTSFNTTGSIALYQSNGNTGVVHNYTFDNMLLTTGLAVTNTGLATISGSAYTSSVLTVSNGTWSATPDSYLYQWYRDGITITGATNNTYTVVAGDSGTQLSAYVQAVKAEYATGGVSTAQVAALGQGINNTAAPTISGNTYVGQVLTSSTGSWSQTPDSYTYQWNRSGAPITGATANTYTIVSADVGVPVTVTVTAIKASYANGNATSAAVTPTASNLNNTALPVISGTLKTGQVVTVSNGSWSVTPDSYTYQWNRDGAAISGATANTYTLAIPDQGLPITATVTAKKGTATTAATSAAVTPSAVTVADPLSFWKTSLANRATSPATVTAMGGAIIEGQGASARNNRWISRLRDMLRRNYRTPGVVGGEGYVAAGFNVTGPDSGWNMWYTSSTGSINYDVWSANLGYRLMGLDYSSSITYTFVGTDIDIWYTSGYGAFSYQVDGGTSSHIAVNTNYLTSNIASVTGLTAGTHTVTISTSSSEQAVINGFTIYNGDKTKGIRLADAGHEGFSLTQYLGDTDHFILALVATNPTLIIMELGGVDAQSSTPAAFQKQLQNFLNYLLGGFVNNSQTPPSVLLVATYLPGTAISNTYKAPWSQYVAALQAVANYSQVGFLDLSAVLPQATSSGTSYYSTDGINPNDYGQHKIAQLVFNAISDTNANYTKGLATWYTALTNRATTPAKWFAVGDSLTEGQGASTLANRWISKTIEILQNNYPVLNVNGGNGFKPGQYATYTPDSTWSNWYTATNGSITASTAGAGPGYRLTFFPQNASRTYPFYGTDIDVWVYNGGGTISYSIDGGAATSVPTANNGATTISSATGLTRGSHTITVTTPSSSGASISGFMIYDGNKSKGVQLYESGHSGATTSVFLNDITNFKNNVATIAPDLITIEIGNNDAATDNVSTVMNNVLTLAGTLSDATKTPAIAIISPYNSGSVSTVSTQAQYKEGMGIIAQAVGGTFIDFSTFMPTTDTSGTGYYRTDGVHPNDSGHTRIANNIVTTLADTRITDPTLGKVLATETWTLPNGSAWPAQWTNTVYSGNTIDIQNSMGHMQSSTASGAVLGNTYLSGMPAVSNTEILVDIMIPNTSIEQFPLIGTRVQTPTWLSNGDPSTGYIFNIYPNLTTNSLQILLSSSFTSLGTANYTFVSGVTYSIRYQMIGSIARARIWQKGNTEPTSWSISVTGASTTTPGKVTLYTENGYAGNGSTAAVIYYDNLTVLAPLAKIYIGNKQLPMGYVGSRPIVAVYIGPNRVL